MGCAGPCGDVVEFGCGYGVFTLEAASLVKGIVFALDIEPELVAETERKAREKGLKNVVPAVRDFMAEGSGLKESSVSYAMLFNILHIENPVQLLKEAYRSVRPGGLAGIIHWKKDENTPRGPSLAIRPTATQCRAWAEEAKFEFVREEELCCCAWHFGLVMRKL